MNATAWMHATALVFLALGLTACNERPAPFKIQDQMAARTAESGTTSNQPGWAYDQPGYMKTAKEPQPEPRVRSGDPLHYFTNEKLVMVRQPAGYTPEETPRVAIWWTDDNGFHWQKAGYFGRQQSFFPFEVEEDGDYGIRFVGPGQETAAQIPSTPERVYHVDTTPPGVEVSVEPEQTWYHAGQAVTINWRTTDYHLVEDPVRIGLLMDFSADEPEILELQRSLAKEGSITYQIPQEALDHEIRFRADATDRAGNQGTGVSFALQIMKEPTADGGETKGQEAGTVEEATTPEPKPEPQRNSLSSTEGGETATPRAPDDNALTQEPDVSLATTPEDDELLDWAGPFFADPTANQSRDREGAVTAIEQGPLPYGEGLETAPQVRGESDADVEMQKTEPAENGTAEAAGAPSSEIEDDLPQEAATEANDAHDVDGADGQVEANKTPTPPPTIEAVAHEAASAMGRSPEPPHEITGVDPTHGNGLLIPLPATVDSEPTKDGAATAHPWRLLNRGTDLAARTIWKLPRTRFTLEFCQAFEGRFLADIPMLRPVGEPGGVEKTLAGMSGYQEQASQTLGP